MKTVTQNVTAYISEYSLVGPKELEAAANDIPARLLYSDTDMSQMWTKVGTATITLTIDSVKDVTMAAVEMLKAKQTKLRADTEAELNTIEGQIQNLLALTYEVKA